MGLDGVELIMELEHDFGLTIPDAAAEQMRTVGDTADYIIARLRERAGTRTGCQSARTFYALRRELTTRFGVPRRHVRPASQIAALVPPDGRRQWQRVADAAGLRREPRTDFRTPFPSPATTVRGLIATLGGKVGFRADGSLDERAILERVRLIVSEQMGVRLEDITRETRYVEDLHF